MNGTRMVVLPRTWALGRRLLGVAVGIALLAGAAFTGASSAPSVSDRTKVHPSVLRAAEARPSSLLPLIVREATPRSDAAERLVEGLGGTVTHDLSIIGSFSARLPGAELDSLLSSHDVLKVWGDGRISMSNMAKYDSANPNKEWQRAIKLLDSRSAGYNGSGVTVAMLDTGIQPVRDLAGRIVASADFTSEGDGLDRYGHGTHMAGIIAGTGASSNGVWSGVAPNANLVSVKVAGADGSTDVSVVIAGLQWIVGNRSAFDIKVLNLSFGTDSVQSYLVDPLNYAVEQVWASGIFVAVAAGNRGPYIGTVGKPGDDPFVVSVGAANLNGTPDRTDDTVAEFSSRGPTQDGLARPDLVAPGISIVSNRVKGSTVDLAHPLAAVDDNYMKGTGTSQATAVIAGVAALMYQANPSMSVNVAKATMIQTSGDSTALLPGGGQGMVNVAKAVQWAKDGRMATRPANQNLVPSTGMGSLELSRGSYHVEVDTDGDGVYELLEGEVGFGWTEGEWAAGSWRTASWSASSWRGDQWSAGSWRASSWSAGSWRSDTWTASSWRSDSWSASSWRASSWRAGSWRESAWAEEVWS
ncbi:MAG TPA: S8 family peptidase [Actinomycetota bacterium]|nr:S8 family peptidase [Actinomycetota bacterium]